MIEHKCPKVIEKVPAVMGLKVGIIVVMLGCCLGFIMTVFNNFIVSLAFPLVGGLYYYVSLRFPQKGELMQYIKYETGHHCIKIDQELKTLIKSK